MTSMFPINQAVRACLVSALLTIFSACGVAAAQPDPNDCSQLSTAGESDCLAREYKGAVALLDQKVRQVIDLAKSADMGFTNPKLAQATREQVLKAIQDAHRAWQSQVEAECNTLLEASFGIGNGGGNADLQCRISMTYERIGYLSSAPAYAWLR